MLFETLATSGLTPKKSSVGNVMSVPDPTIVLMMPAPVPASAMATADQNDTRSPYRGRRVSSEGVMRQCCDGGSGGASGRSAGVAGGSIAGDVDDGTSGTAGGGVSPAPDWWIGGS